MKLIFCSLLRQKSFPSPCNLSSEILIEKQTNKQIYSKARAYDSLGARPVGLLELSSMRSPQEGFRSACLHTEVQMAAKPISVTIQRSRWERLVEQSHNSYPYHQVAKIWRQLKIDNFREGTQGDISSLIKTHWKLFFLIGKSRKNYSDLFLN